MNSTPAPHTTSANPTPPPSSPTTTAATDSQASPTQPSQPPADTTTPHPSEPRSWQLTIPAPDVKPVRKRKTGKIVTRKPWLNSNDRDHWRATKPIKNDWRATAAERAAIHQLPEGLHRIRIDAYIQRTRRGRTADAGNFYPTVKPIVDGLVDYGLIPDDNDKHLEGPFLHPAPIADTNAVILTITEVAA